MHPERSDNTWQALFSGDGWVPLILATMARLYLGITLCLAAIALLPLGLGWSGSVVQSGSMEPHISSGDVVLSSPWNASDTVPLGGVVSFTSPARAEPDGREKTRLHRVVGAREDGTFVTAGDANADVDSTPLDPRQITGRARLLVPFIGLPGFWLGHGALPSVTLWSAGTMAAVLCAVYRTGAADRRRPPPGSGLPTARHAKAAPPARPWGTRPRVLVAVLVAAFAAVAVLGATGAWASAAFTAATPNTGNTFAASEDWNPPTVSLVDPGPSVKDTTTIAANAQDAESGIGTVAFEYLREGASEWTGLCTATTAPYACSWNTRSLPDGSYGLRARATDKAGHATTSAATSTTVANNLLVVLANPGEAIRGSVALTSTLFNPGTTGYTVRIEYSVAGTNKWTTLCTTATSPYRCTWNTAGAANDSYDLRSVAIAGNAATYSATIADVTVDNLAPTVAISDPGSPLSGTRTLAASTSDAHSGVAELSIQYARTGTSTWTTACTLSDTPYSCRFDTTKLADGGYSFRALSTDAAGNGATSSTVANRIVDNTVSSVSLEDPGTYLSGNVPLAATANSTAGVGAVRIQATPAGTSAWTTVCTATTAPYGCTWNTTASPDGIYDLRAVLTDGSGKETASATLAARRVDNSPLRAADIQTTNGGATAGRLETGDAISFSYSQQVNPATITPGWAGAPLAVTLRLRDGNLIGLSNTDDTLDIQRSGSSVNLGTVNLRQNYAKSRKTVLFNATMSATTQTVGGVPRTVVTVTVGSNASGAASLRTVNTPSAMAWTPTTAVTTPAGSPCSLAPLNEPGTLDREF